MNPQDFNQYLGNLTSVNSAVPATPTPQAAQQPAQAAPSSGGGASWIKSLLPTIGGIGGGILGGVVDAASLGIAAPLINPITGAAAGGAAGQAAENALDKKNPFQANDLTAGVENAAGEAVGAGAAKAVGKLGEGIVSAGAKAGDKAATDAAAATNSSKAINDAEATRLNYGGIHDDVQKSLKLGDSQQFVKNMGFDETNPAEMQKVSSAGDVLNNVYDAALQNAKPVDMSDASKLLGATQQSPNALTQAESAALAKQGVAPELSAKGEIVGAQPGDSTTYQGINRNDPVGQALSEYNRGRGAEPLATLDDQMPATEVRKLQQAVGHQIGNTQKTINGAVMNGNYSADMRGTLDDLNQLYGNLGDKIKTPELNQAIQQHQLGDADVQGLKSMYGDKLGQNLADTVNNAKSADDLLSPMQQFTRMGQASDMALEDINQVKAGPRAVAREKFAQNGGIAPSSKSASSGGAGDLIQGAANVLHKPTAMVIAAGRKLNEAGVTPKIAKGLGNVIQRTAPLMKPVAQVASNIPNMASGMGEAASAIPNGGGDAMQPAAQPAAMNPNSPASILDSLNTDLSATGGITPNAGSYISGINALAPMVQSNQLAGNAMSALAPTYANAGGASGLGGGLLDKLLAAVPGTAQNTYQSQQQATAAQLAKLLGITPQAAMAMLPQLAQNPGTAAPQLGATSGLVGQLTAGMPVQ